MCDCRLTVKMGGEDRHVTVSEGSTVADVLENLGVSQAVVLSKTKDGTYAKLSQDSEVRAGDTLTILPQQAKLG